MMANFYCMLLINITLFRKYNRIDVFKEEEEKEAKAAEAEVYFKELDTDADGFITVQELQAKQGLDTNKVKEMK